MKAIIQTCSERKSDQTYQAWKGWGQRQALGLLALVFAFITLYFAALRHAFQSFY
jgi:hypothetical protein